MFIRSILTIAAVAALVMAGPVAAQSKQTPPNGLGSAVMPTGIELHPFGGGDNNTLSFIVRRPGQTGLDWAGLCMLAFTPLDKPTTMENWTTISGIYYGDAEAKARKRVTDSGGTFERMLTNKPWTSKTGWPGWFTAYQAINGKGVSESNVFAGTQLSGNVRVVLSCTSSEGQAFNAADLTVIEKLGQSVSN